MWLSYIKDRFGPQLLLQTRTLTKTDRKTLMQITARDRLFKKCCEQSLVWTSEGLYLTFTFCLWRQNGCLQRHLNAAPLFTHVLYMYLMFSCMEPTYVHSNSVYSYNKQSKQSVGSEKRQLRLYLSSFLSSMNRPKWKVQKFNTSVWYLWI